MVVGNIGTKYVVREWIKLAKEKLKSGLCEKNNTSLAFLTE
jgi:hypothetical protein